MTDTLPSIQKICLTDTLPSIQKVYMTHTTINTKNMSDGDIPSR